MDRKVLYIWLSKIKGIGPVLARKLLNHFGNIERVYNCSLEELYEIDGIGKKTASIIMGSKDIKESEIVFERCNKNMIKVLTLECNDYPKQIRDNDKAPIVLYVKGWLRDFENSVAVVGSRSCTNYGKEVTIDICTELSKRKNPIIGGMAKGIDGYAHTVALNNDNYTVAVLGTGVDICYPSEHLSLMNKILENGLLISQFEPGTTNVRSNFIKRNELIAMLSEKIIVVEASKDCGSLYTAQCGIKYGKEVYAVPGNINSPYSKGTNLLINNGVKPYLSISSIINDVDNESTDENIMLSTKTTSILDIVGNNGMSLDNFKNNTDFIDIDLQEALLELEMKGLIKQRGGLYYSV